MLDSKKVACVIPARLQSSRFPRKILALLEGKPLIQWAWEAAHKIPFFDEVVFAIDDEETAKVIQGFQGKYFMTALSCLSGTDRLVELKMKGHVKADIWVNWQADEPFVTEKIVRDLLQSAGKDSADVWTLKKRLYQESEALASDVCKVVCDSNGCAMYFSRSPIPYYRQRDVKEKIYYKHVGLYAFSDAALSSIFKLSPCEIELAESLEQLRFLFYGLKIKVHETEHETIGIDLPEHLEKAKKYLKSSN